MSRPIPPHGTNARYQSQADTESVPSMPRRSCGRRSGLTPAVTEDVRRLFAAEPWLTVAEIACELGCAVSTAHGYIRQLDLRRPIRRKSRADREQRRRRLRTLLNAVPRPTAAQLARQLGVTRATIMRDCRRLEVTLCEDARLTPRRTLLWRCRCGGVAPAPDGHPTCRDRAVG